MFKNISEPDWKLFRNLREVALERLCQNVVEQIQATAGSSQSYHERYLAIYGLVQERDKQIADTFDSLSRSTALMSLVRMRSLDLVSDSEIGAFSNETQQVLNFFRQDK